MSRAISWKKVLVVRPHPGQAETWGRNERRPRDWSTCCATWTSCGPVASGLRREADPDRVADPSLQQERQAGRRGDDALGAHAGLGEAEVQRVVAPIRQPGVDLDQVLDAGHLGRQDDPVVPEARLLGEPGRAQRRLDHRLDHHLAAVVRVGRGGIRVHHLGQQLLVERPPVDPDADRDVVGDRHLDDLGELLVAPLRADVARVDPVLGEGRGRLGVLREQQVPVVVEVPDQRHADAERIELGADDGHGLRGGIVVDGDPHELGAGMRELRDLDRGARPRRRCPCSSSTARRPGGPTRRARRRRARWRWIAVGVRSSLTMVEGGFRIGTARAQVAT